MHMKIPIALSNRHIHLSIKDKEKLFGEDYKLTKYKDLSQPGQFACIEKLDIEGVKGMIKGVRILGPERKNTQLEISLTDSRALGVAPPIRDSGDIEKSSSMKLIGPKGELVIEEGTIIAARHIHFHTEDVKNSNIKEGDLVKVKIKGDRPLIFENVLARISDNYKLEMHVDIDEGNAGNISNGDIVEVINE